MGKYNEKNIRWMAKVTDKLENDKYAVVFSINSIEADMNKTSFGRPRTNEKKIVDIMDIVLLQPALECN
jgi:predicted RND superfamily exporter protein